MTPPPHATNHKMHPSHTKAKPTPPRSDCLHLHTLKTRSGTSTLLSLETIRREIHPGPSGFRVFFSFLSLFHLPVLPRNLNRVSWCHCLTDPGGWVSFLPLIIKSIDHTVGHRDKTIKKKPSWKKKFFAIFLPTPPAPHV